MTATISQQAAAIETARRIVVGAIKLPRPNSSQCQLLSQQLIEAAETLRGLSRKEGGHGA